MTDLYLIRHARQLSADAPDDQLLPDDQDGLTARGLDQARRLANYVEARIKPDALYASPLLRARQTAQAITDCTGLAPQLDDRLREIRLNFPSTTTANEIMSLWLKARRRVDQPAFAGGESWLNLQNRSVAVIERIAQAHAKQSIVIVTHGGVIETLFFYFLGIPLERSLQSFVHIDHTGIFHWRPFHLKEDSGWELLAANDTRHLD